LLRPWQGRGRRLGAGNGFVTVCRFDQGAAVEGLGVGC